MENFTLGKCSYCKKYKALKDNVCAECNAKIEIPDFLKELFEKKTNKEE